jgi:antitoxin FitA
MAMLTVRNLPDEVHRALRVRAAEHGQSMEAEVRAILYEAVKPSQATGLGTLLAESSRDYGLEDSDIDAMEEAIAENRRKYQTTQQPPVSFE